MENQTNYQGFTVITLLHAPSLIYNNLISFADKLLFSTNAEPSSLSLIIDSAILNNSTTAATASIKSQEMTDISHTGCYMLGGQWHIVLGFSGSIIQLWNNNGTRMLSHIKPTAAKSQDMYPIEYLSSAYTKAQDGTELICIGDSQGNIQDRKSVV